jgi:hypothetical protein
MYYPRRNGFSLRVKRARGAMLSGLTKRFRVRAAIVTAALYALCMLAPAAAFAFSNNPAVPLCLTEGHVGVHNSGGMHDHGAAHDHGTVHVHADGSVHQHHDDGTAPQRTDDKARVASCCGLFSVVAIAGEPGPSLGLYSLASVVLPVVGEALSGRGPERINRPPIS